jgi:hypothetical protein
VVSDQPGRPTRSSTPDDAPLPPAGTSRARAKVTVTFHLPFDCGIELWRESPSLLAAELPMRADDAPELVLQQYAPELRENLRRRFPHEVWGTTVPTPAAATQLERELAADGVHWEFASARVSIWDGGAGLLVLTYAVSATDMWSWTALDAVIDRAAKRIRDSPVWAAAVAETAAEARAAAKSVVDRPSQFGHLDMEPPTFSWCHRTVVVALEVWDEVSARKIAETFVWGGTVCQLGQDTPQSVLHLALTACYVGTVDDIGLGASGGAGAAALERLISVHTAVWRSLQTYESRLVEIAVEWRSHREEPAARQMARLDQLLGVYEAMQGGTASLRGLEVHLSSLDQSLWQALSRQWGLEQRLDSIDALLRTVRDLYSTAAAHAGARRAERFTNFAWLFTLLGAVSTCLAIVGFISPRQNTVWRATSVGATVCAVTFVWLAFWTWQRGSIGNPYRHHRDR